MYRMFCSFLLSCLFGHAVAQPVPSDPKTAIGWFQRANDQMNIRMPGSTPFHMKVEFQAFPGEELLGTKEKSQIMTGDGLYEEIWLAPHHWRREVTFGSYHAVEVETGQGRKMQASSGYEPSRVLTLLWALLYPVTRDEVSREFQTETGPVWKVDHVMVGNVSLVRISRSFGNQSGNISDSYYFLPQGPLLIENGAGITTSRENDKVFAGKIVPTHISVGARERELVKAELTIEPQGEPDPSLFDLAVPPAEPGETLRPLTSLPGYGVKMPNLDEDYNTFNFGPGRTRPGLVIWRVLDKNGRFREVELIFALREEDKQDAASYMSSMRRAHHRPPEIDGNPCEVWAPMIFM